MMRTALIIILFCLVSQASAGDHPDSLVWPGPPARPRLRHIVTLSSAESFQQEGGTLSKIFKFFFGGERSTPWLVQPVGIAVSGNGIIYVADPGAKGVHRIDEREKKHAFVMAAKNGDYRSPVGIACAQNGTVYISDSEAGIVVIADEDLDAKGVIKEHLVRPTGMCIVHDTLYVVDTGKHKVVRFDLEGKYLGEFGERGVGEGQFNYPVQIVGRDELCVVDALNYRVELFSLGGTFQRLFGRQGNAIGRFASPKGIALDSENNIYVTDALLNNLQIFNLRGELLLSVGQEGTHNGQFETPNGIAIDVNDRVYIVDTLNKRVQIFQYLK